MPTRFHIYRILAGPYDRFIQQIFYLFFRKMTSVITQKSGESSDKRMVTYIHETLKNLRLDKVETAQYTVEVPSLDADNPSEITLSKSGDEVLVLKYGGKNSTEPLKKEGGPIVAIPGRARVRILYTLRTYCKHVYN